MKLGKFQNFKELVLGSILAGFLIACAGAIYIRCDNKIVGAVLFSIGLIGVILLQGNLFTGKIGYVNSKETATQALVILLINLVVAYCIGLLYKTCVASTNVIDTKLTKTWLQVLWDSMICGVCIYLAVAGFKKSNNILVIIIPVVAFILSGAEHCIADAFYFGTGNFSAQGLLFIFLTIIGNSIGSIIINKLQRK